MTALRRKLIEHEIKKYEELQEMFEKKTTTADLMMQVKYYSNSERRSHNLMQLFTLKRNYMEIALNMRGKKLTWQHLLQEQQ
jgi:hypothetical protein